MLLYGILGVLVAILVFLILYFITANPVFTVQEQQAVIIERLGKFYKVYGPGMHVIFPPFDKRRKIMEGGELHLFVDQRERSVDLPKQTVITRDNVQLEVDSVAYYEISDPRKAVYGVNDVIDAVNQLIKTVLRDVIGDTMLQELLSGRESINKRLREQVENASGDWGISIRSVELQAVTPPASYAEAMRRVSEAELAKKAEITRAEGKKQASVLEAEGEAEKINRIYQAIHEGNPNDELLKVKYLEALEKIADGKATKVFMPFPANPTSGDFFQQAFGMAAGFDAYNSPVRGERSWEPPRPRPSEESQTTPISSEEKAEQPKVVKKKTIIRRVPKKPPDTSGAQNA